MDEPNPPQPVPALTRAQQIADLSRRLDKTLAERDDARRQLASRPALDAVGLAKRLTDNERTYSRLASSYWERLDTNTAIYYRGIAEGFEGARDLLAQAIAQSRPPHPEETADV